MKKANLSLLVLALAGTLGLSACGDGDDGVDGVNGVNGVDGTNGADGRPGLSAGEFAATVESPADLVVTLAPSDIVVAGTEPFSVKFTAMAKNAAGELVPFLGLEQVQFYVGNQTENTSGTGSPYVWANNALVNGFGTYMYCNAEGVASVHGEDVNACTLAADPENPGTYVGSWEHEGNAPVVLADGDMNSLYRVVIRSYATNSEGVQLKQKLMSKPLDFIPATGELAESAKDMVPTTACNSCHGTAEGFDEGDERIANITSHHGHYQSALVCAVCHNPTTAAENPDIGFNLDFASMVHTIHSGARNTEEGNLTGEAAEWFGKINLPGDVADCTACHTNDEAYNTAITAAACQGCHMDVNFVTGEGHSEFNLAQADDTQCVACHSSGELSPINAHKIGDRAATIAALDVSVSDVTYTEGATDADADTMTVTLAVAFNGEAVPAGFDFGEYALSSRVAALMVGTIDEYGMPTAAFTMGLSGVAADATGHVTVTTTDTLNLAGESIYVAANILLCNDVDGNLASCANAHKNRISVAMPTKYWNLATADGSNANIGRFSQPERMSADEAGCGNCHGTLVNHHYGNLTFSQCANCHNNNAPGSAFPDAYVQNGVDADGEPTFAPLAITPFANHDLATVSHRLHSGIQTRATGALIYRDQAGAIQNYPAADTDCAVCHVEGKTVFADDGGLTSGRRAIAVSDADDNVFYVSPTAEACRSCHAHADAAAYAHFRSNGAVTIEDAVTDPNLPIESCSTCHAAGKTYGVDKVHMMK